MRGIGIDIGSRTIKIAVLNSGMIEDRDVVDATSRPLEIARFMLEKHRGVPVVATGYGRRLLETDGIKTVTEIKACAKGIGRLYNGSGIIIDIGGQDVKVISLDADGNVARFEMNDRCAAGTGKFLEIMADKLDYRLEDFGKAALYGTDETTISSLCTVFAESEVIGLLNMNKSRENIARAVHRSVIKKITGMFKRIECANDAVYLVGGGALNDAVRIFLEEELKIQITVPDNPRIIAALGAAVIASE